MPTRAAISSLILTCLAVGAAIGYWLGQAQIVHSETDVGNGAQQPANDWPVAESARASFERQIDELVETNRQKETLLRLAQLSNNDLQSRLSEFEQREWKTSQQNKRLAEPLAWLQTLLPAKFADLTPEQLANLRELDLSSSKVDNEDLRHLEHLGALRTLTLRRTAITNDGLPHLSKLHSLRRLGLRESQVTDEGMKHLAGLTSLTYLDLNMLPITDDGLRHIQSLTSLEFLRLNYTLVSDKGLAHLQNLHKLARLDLWALKITDRGTDKLWHLPSLAWLELGATPITKDWVERFEAAHPDCYVRSRYSR